MESDQKERGRDDEEVFVLVLVLATAAATAPMDDDCHAQRLYTHNCSVCSDPSSPL